MDKIVNQVILHVATVNGSGSQSANNILVRTLFRMGLPVSGKNLFPSNIAGLPTWFTIRVNGRGYTSRLSQYNIVVAMNPATITEDFKSVHPGGFLFYNSEIKLPADLQRSDIHIQAVPFKDLVAKVTDSIKLKKLLTNMIYVGILFELMGVPQDVAEATIRHQFQDKEKVVSTNLQALLAGREYVRNHLQNLTFPYVVQPIAQGNQDHILIDGNSAAALGLTFGGCQFVAWYPITPSSSLVETFIDVAEQHRVLPNGEKTFAVVQAEDELASICMVLGAGWAGARAMTATSGPGMSLMAEAAGLSYYAEVPAVIWNVQRVGPSTGLPTRTMQGDLLSSVYLSHGDTKHVVLIPANPEECFSFAQEAFDLAERLQTLVIVLTDLDLGMNLHIAKKFPYPDKPFNRGKVLNKNDLERVGQFARYRDVDGDGITYRTLPGTEHPLAGYFTRGTGHDEQAKYSENNEIFKANMDRLTRKYQTARSFVPQPEILQATADTEIGLLAYGSSHAAIGEAREHLTQRGLVTNYLRLRALPLTNEVTDFIDAHERIYVIEQNRDAQLTSILRHEYPQWASRFCPILQYDGLPLEARHVESHVWAKERL